jgi:hypothetical protein
MVISHSITPPGDKKKGRSGYLLKVNFEAVFNPAKLKPAMGCLIIKTSGGFEVRGGLNPEPLIYLLVWSSGAAFKSNPK